MPDKMSAGQDRRAAGVRRARSSSARRPSRRSTPTATTRSADRLAAETPGGWNPNQYANPLNPAAHYATTGPEIWRADRRAGHALRRRRRHRRHDQRHRPLPQGGLRRGGCRSSAPTPRARSTPAATGRPYLVEGVGEDFWPTTYDRSIADRIIAVSDRDSFAHHPAAGARGGAAGRRLLRPGRRRRAAAGRRS